jgi:hypothetical protein
MNRIKAHFGGAIPRIVTRHVLVWAEASDLGLYPFQAANRIQTGVKKTENKGSVTFRHFIF